MILAIFAVCGFASASLVNFLRLILPDACGMGSPCGSTVGCPSSSSIFSRR